MRLALQPRSPLPALLLAALALSPAAEASSVLVTQASKCLTELHHGSGLDPRDNHLDIDSEYGNGGRGAFTFLDLEKNQRGEAGFYHFNPHQLPASAFCSIPGGVPKKTAPVLIDVIMARPADENDYLLSVTSTHPRMVWVSPDQKVTPLAAKEKVLGRDVLRATCRTEAHPSHMTALKRHIVQILKTVGQGARKAMQREGTQTDGVSLTLNQFRGALRKCSAIPDAAVQKAIAQAKTDLELSLARGNQAQENTLSLPRSIIGAPEASAGEAAE
jgi:hypothetical protein